MRGTRVDVLPSGCVTGCETRGRRSAARREDLIEVLLRQDGDLEHERVLGGLIRVHRTLGRYGDSTAVLGVRCPG